MSSDISGYLKKIPAHNHCKLDKELDYDNEVDRDLIEISQYIIKWQEKLRVPLGLTERDVHRINQKDPPLRQEEVLRVWKEKQKFEATYKNLLMSMVAGGDHKTATEICKLQIFEEPEPVSDCPLQEANTQENPPIPQPQEMPQISSRSGSPLDPDVQMDLQQQLKANFRMIKDQFASYVTCIYEKIETKKIKISALRVHLGYLLSTDELNSAKTVEDIFHLLRSKTSFLDYKIFESLRQNFFPKDNHKLLQYPKHLEDYVNKHKISEFLQINPGLEKHTCDKKLIIKFGGIEETDRIAKVLDVQQAFADILSMKKSALRLFDIKRGCVVVTFLVPDHIASSLFPHGLEFTQEQTAQLQALSVEWIIFNDEKMDILDGVLKPKVQDVHAGGLCEYPQLPGIIFSDTSTPRGVTISGKATRIEEKGISLSIPDNAISQDVPLSIATSCSDSFEVPDPIESVSPAYLIGTTTMIEFSKDVDLVLQHTTNLRTAEDCKDMVVMKASLSDSDRGIYSRLVETKCNDVTFKELKHVKILKLKSLVPCRKKNDKEVKELYSARLYKTVVGYKLEALFCMCPDHPVYTEHCDAFVANIHPEFEISRGTFINALSFNSEQVSLKTEDADWEVAMDRNVIMKSEVDSPLLMKTALSSMNDYPPRIRIQLIPPIQSEKPVTMQLKVLGLSGDCFFEVSSDSLDLNIPAVYTKDFKISVDEFKNFLSLQDPDNSLVSCGMDITKRMERMESQLRHPKALSELLKSVKYLQRLIDDVIELAEKEKADTGTVTKILHKFDKLSPKIAKQLSSAGDIISSRVVIYELKEVCVELVNFTKKLFKSSAPLHMDPNFPGHVLSQPSQQASITSRGKIVDLDDTLGLSLSIPKGAVAEGADLAVATGFSGGPELPDDMESVSPAYLFETVTTIEFSKDVFLRLQHAANLETAEDWKDMITLQSSIFPSQGSGRVQVDKQVEGTTIEFSESGHCGVIKIRSLFSSCYKILKKKHNEHFYSARLYQTTSGVKISAVFCVCLQNSDYIQHCDRVISKYYPEMVGTSSWRCINYVTLTSDKIGLAVVDNGAWEISFDRSEISKKEIHSPKRLLGDYPPRIYINLTAGSRSEVIPYAELKITGSKNEQSFFITNERCLRTVDTRDFMDVTRDLEEEVLQLSDGPLVTCALEMVTILYQIEPLLLNLGSIESLIQKVKDLEQLSGTIMEKLGATKGDVATELSGISEELKKMALVLSTHHVPGLPELWKAPAEMLIKHCKDLVRCIMKLLKDEVRDVTSVFGVSLKSLHLIKWSKGKFRLVNQVSSRWKEFGTLLNVEQNQLADWRNECRDDADRCWDKVMGHWLSTGGTSDYPATWGGLYLLLEDVGFFQVAAKLKEIISEINK